MLAFSFFMAIVRSFPHAPINSFPQGHVSPG
ncbi:uncharacterized protein CCOS01_07809 [Colletotrichum costaricense]|uniref:Uncharacterized protein n=2 Tax=Colletotrichum acutatum species complex TaxID=2707335 RepID=A0AAI9YX95_9PEZI|nr:uncharacterized protein CCOS01_07809 [Colletotrichum costaricense]XP_060384634.1 uncharacterized protein CTAM01_04650 [Colletotrichum tamarilloi]KAK1503338.1 hypothetical protein CTAM01_04650 [Colletotrichum tamarilloi]KAK1527547.1 hypothetical protein CCOS01_07809 [Colletotrichum costaricense]